MKPKTKCRCTIWPWCLDQHCCDPLRIPANKRINSKRVRLMWWLKPAFSTVSCSRGRSEMPKSVHNLLFIFFVFFFFNNYWRFGKCIKSRLILGFFGFICCFFFCISYDKFIWWNVFGFHRRKFCGNEDETKNQQIIFYDLMYVTK